VSTIRTRLREQASPRHVPDDVFAVPSIPRTRTGKKLEVPVKRILAGARASEVLSLDAVDDPSALDSFIDLAASRGAQAPKPARASVSGAGSALRQPPRRVQRPRGAWRPRLDVVVANRPCPRDWWTNGDVHRLEDKRHAQAG